MVLCTGSVQFGHKFALKNVGQGSAALFCQRIQIVMSTLNIKPPCSY